MSTFSRRSFFKAAGVATGTAMISISPAAAAALEPAAKQTAPSGPLPDEPIVAVIRNAELGEVTVLVGTTEQTYKDKQLVKRLLAAAARHHQPRQGVA
jgi:3-hydroxyisobutyrate dehydrogenase-like beta-hydroxyacid dehydrogenase